MNPFIKCCGYYCAMLMCVALYFFVVLIILEQTKSPFMHDFQEPNDDYHSKTIAMAIAIGVRIILLSNK